MASSPSPKTPPVKDLIKSAHQLWALACWATLRDAWSKRTELKGGLVLPPRVEAFFGWYCHRAYLRWIPAVEREILERPEKQKEYRQRKAEEEANERQKSSKTLQNARVAVDSDAGGAVRSEALEEGEEIAGIRISQYEADFADWDRENNAGQDEHPAGGAGWGEEDDVVDGKADDEEDDATFKPRRSGGSSRLPGGRGHSVHIERPALPEYQDDHGNGRGRKPFWEAWHRTLIELDGPTKESKRVLMNELFKQALSSKKKTATPSDMLSCLTGYLKAIVREAVRNAAKEQRRVIGTESIVFIHEPLGRSEAGGTQTGEDMLADSRSIEEELNLKEFTQLGEPLGQREFAGPKMTDDVRLGYFVASLKRLEGKDGDQDNGFTVGLNNPAIAIELGGGGYQRHRERMLASMERLAQEVEAMLPAEDFQSRRTVQATAVREIMRLSTEWFWSEKIPFPLFKVVMALINSKNKHAFACPHAASILEGKEISATCSTRRERCWGCPSK